MQNLLIFRSGFQDTRADYAHSNYTVNVKLLGRFTSGQRCQSENVYDC